MKDFIKKHQHQLKVIALVSLLLYVFSLCTIIAVKTAYNTAPDEALKYPICEYIMKNLSLPVGSEPSIRSELWGFSYAYTPILSYTISGLFMKIISFISDNSHLLLIAARLVSVVCIVGFTAMCYLIGSKLFKNDRLKWLFVIMVSLLPQVLYLGGYINNDSLALFSISIIVYSWILGIEKNWSWKSCILLALGISICFLSYYNAYGYILCSVLFYFVSSFYKKVPLKTFLVRGFSILAITLSLSGWWFVRNAYLYNGDMLGISAQRESGEIYAVDNYKPSQRSTYQKAGTNILDMLTKHDWIVFSIESFIGLFGYMNLLLDPMIYLLYFIIFTGGLIGFLYIIIRRRNDRILGRKQTKGLESIESYTDKDRKGFLSVMVVSIIIPIILSVYYSYAMDFQPQGRYILPIIIPLFYFITLGIENLTTALFKNKKLKIATIYAIIAIFIFVSLSATYYIAVSL